MRTLVWFRGKDLRIADHAPLRAALPSPSNPKAEVIPLFVLDEHFFRPEVARRMPNRIQFLLESIASLAANLEHLGSRLILVEGRSVEQLLVMVSCLFGCCLFKRLLQSTHYRGFWRRRIS